MARLGYHRWVFVTACALSSAGMVGACGGKDENPLLEDPVAGNANEGGDTGNGSGGSGGASSGASGKGASGTSGTAGKGSANAGGEGGEAGGGVEPPETCSEDEECAPAGLVCDPGLEKCVACFFDSDCAGGALCRDSTCLETTPCETSLDCTDADDASVCDANNGRCVECVGSNDCPENNECVNNGCEPYQSCQNSLDCPVPTVCDTAEGRCYPCVRHADCGTSSRCVEHGCRTACQSDNACTGQGMLCNLSGGYCVSCLSNSDCPAIYHCAAGECARDACESGTKRCQGNAVATCRDAGDGYTTTACGTRQTCVADGADTDCEDWVCTAGEVECDVANRALIRCSDDGLVADVEEDCEEQGEICYEERCQDLECVPSALFCDGETLRLCSADGGSSSLYATCLSGEVCSDELRACTPQVCAPGQPYCDDNRAHVCNSRGSGPADEGSECSESDGLTCLGGECVCLTTHGDCDDDMSNGCEKDVSSDPENCGVCERECSDEHVVSPSCSSGVCNSTCSSGYYDCNSDKLGDGCETNTNGDEENCGACDVVCSTNHATARCTSGTCDSPCSDGYSDCNGNKQADGCETDTSTDPDRCGGCSTSCSSAGMATRTCNGTCNGTCSVDYLDCNDDKQTDGCEVDRRFDERHCGDCDTVCDEGESCVNGVCGACNNTVLFLADTYTAANNIIESALESDGLDVTRIDNGITAYTGTPAASGFGAVLIPVGGSYNTVAGSGSEAAIIAANAAGTGVLLTGWAGYRVSFGYWSSTFGSAVMLTGYTQSSTKATQYTLTATGHPIWSGLATSFAAQTDQFVELGPVLAGATMIATCAGCGSPGAAVVVRDPTDGRGRGVMLAHAANYEANTWYQNANMLKMFTNAAKWATRCQ